MKSPTEKRWQSNKKNSDYYFPAQFSNPQPPMTDENLQRKPRQFFPKPAAYSFTGESCRHTFSEMPINDSQLRNKSLKNVCFWLAVSAHLKSSSHNVEESAKELIRATAQESYRIGSCTETDSFCI